MCFAVLFRGVCFAVCAVAWCVLSRVCCCMVCASPCVLFRGVCFAVCAAAWCVLRRVCCCVVCASPCVLRWCDGGKNHVFVTVSGLKKLILFRKQTHHHNWTEHTTTNKPPQQSAPLSDLNEGGVTGHQLGGCQPGHHLRRLLESFPGHPVYLPVCGVVRCDVAWGWYTGRVVMNALFPPP